MKIAIDVTPILPGGRNGGAKQLVMELLAGFGTRAKADEFILLTSDFNDDIFIEFKKFGMKTFCVNKAPSGPANRVIDRVRKGVLSGMRQGILRKNRIAALFCPLTAPTYREAGIPTVSVIHDLQHLYYPSFFSDGELAHRRRFYEKLNKKADYVVCISSYTRKCVMENLSLPDGRVFSIPNCVQSRLMFPSPMTAGAETGKFGVEGRKYCIYPANFWPHKNHKMLLVAFNMFIRKHLRHDLHLVLTGAGIDNVSDIEDAIKRMQLGNRVHFLGYLTDEELSVVWAGAHFLFFPSLFEGFGIPLVEAMRYGKPIIASHATSIPEVAGPAALYFDPKKPDEMVSAMERLMEDEMLYQALVKKGQERLDDFKFEDMVDRYISVLHEAGRGR